MVINIMFCAFSFTVQSESKGQNYPAVKNSYASNMSKTSS